MKCICIRDCTVRIGGKSYYFAQDEIAEFDKCPTWFKSIDNKSIDFDSATVELLLESPNWTYPEAVAYLKDNFNKNIVGPKLSKREMAETIVDTRDRAVVLPNEE